MMGDMADDAEADWYAAGCPEFDEDAGPEDWRATDSANAFLEQLLDKPMFTQEEVDGLKQIGRKYVDGPYGEQELNYIRAGKFARKADTRAKYRTCSRCGAEPGRPCVYTSDNQIHTGPDGQIVWNEIGKPMLITHKERRRPPQQGEETVPGMNKEAALAMAAEAGRALAAFAKLEAKYGQEPEDGSVIRFSKKWDALASAYSYAAIRVSNLWYTTGLRYHQKGYSWEDLMNWLDSVEPVDDLQIVTPGGWQDYPGKG
jgi:hypothetical protein